MNILLFNQSSDTGGGNTIIRAYVKYLSKNHTVNYVTDLLTASVLRDIILRKYDRYIYNIYSPRYLLLISLSRLFHVPTSITVFGVWALELKSQKPNRSKLVLFKYWLTQYIILLLANIVIVLSKYEYTLVRERFPLLPKRKVHIVPCGIDSEIFQQVSFKTKNLLRSELNLPLNKKIFLIASRIERRKGIDLAIEAFSQIISDHPNTMLVIVFPSGKYNYNDHLIELFQLVLKRKIGPNVHFITGINNFELAKYYQACDAFISSSRYLETFGLTVLEAISCGCVVLGFDIDARAEILKQINSRLLISTVNSTMLAKKIEWYLSLKSVDITRIKDKSKKVSQNYTWDNSLSQIESLLTKKNHHQKNNNRD